MNKRTRELKLRVSEDERQAILQKARDCGLTMSKYVRYRALGLVTRSHPQDEIIRNLLDIVSLLQQADKIIAEKMAHEIRAIICRIGEDNAGQGHQTQH